MFVDALEPLGTVLRRFAYTSMEIKVTSNGRGEMISHVKHDIVN